MFPDSKVHGANMGPIWGRQDPGGPHIGPMNFAIWIVVYVYYIYIQIYEVLKCEISTAAAWAMLSDQQNLPNDWYKKNEEQV